MRRFIRKSISKESAPEVKEPTDKPKKIKKIYTMRDVIKQRFSEKVADEIPFKTTDPGYIGSYQRAVTTVLENLNGDDLEAAGEMLEQWNKNGGPSDVQQM